MASAIITTAFGNLQINSTKTGVTELLQKKRLLMNLFQMPSPLLLNKFQNLLSINVLLLTSLDLNGICQAVYQIGAQHFLWHHHFYLRWQLGDTKVRAVANAIGKTSITTYALSPRSWRWWKTHRIFWRNRKILLAETVLFKIPCFRRNWHAKNRFK